MMGKYSIKELEQLSGIKAHTIRIWEKRHGLISPSRTSTNIRYYSDDDLKKIINVATLSNHGLKISRIADMTTEEMNRKVLEISETRDETSVHIDQLIVAMIDMEEEQFEKILSRLVLRYGFEKAVTDIFYPFLDKIGILWQTQNITPAHEHFISNLIRQKIIVAIDALPIQPKTSKRVLLFLPETELHEIGLLFYHYLTRKAGYRTYYLGQSLPHPDLVKVVEIHQPHILVTSISSPLSEPLESYLRTLSQDFPTQLILATGLQVQNLKGIKINNIRTIGRVSEIYQFL